MTPERLDELREQFHGPSTATVMELIDHIDHLEHEIANLKGIIKITAQRATERSLDARDCRHGLRSCAPCAWIDGYPEEFLRRERT